MTKLEALALVVLSIVVMFGVFWVKAVYVDAPVAAKCTTEAKLTNF